MKTIQNGVNYFTLESGYINQLKEIAIKHFLRHKVLTFTKLKKFLKVDKDKTQIVINLIKFEHLIKPIDKNTYEMDCEKFLKGKSRVYMRKKNPDKKILISDIRNKYLERYNSEKELLKKDTDNMDLFEKVKLYIKDKETISATRIQCEFSVGYPKASKIMGQLIEEGLIEINSDGKYLVRK